MAIVGMTQKLFFPLTSFHKCGTFRCNECFYSVISEAQKGLESANKQACQFLSIVYFLGK